MPKPYSIKLSSWMVRFFLFIRVKKEGIEDPEAQMFILNHESDIDIGVMETITKRDLAWVAKKELFDVPFLGWLVKLPKDIPVERESKTSLIKLLRDVKDRIDHGRVITIFPEGTRSSKNKMLPFKAGAKIAADKYKLKVQPVVFINTASYYNIKTKHYNPGLIKAIYLDSFYADKADKEWLKELRVKMQAVYDNEISKIDDYR
jgi:1-acyl-sn-glycerol-3-phosphate acyltransferase